MLASGFEKNLFTHWHIWLLNFRTSQNKPIRNKPDYQSQLRFKYIYY